MLTYLDVEDKTVTADAMHCQRETCRRIMQRKGDFLFGLKENQPPFFYETGVYLIKKELIINAASQSCSMPLSANEAAIGIVPYIQRGEAIPRAEAGTMPKAPRRFPWIERNNLCIESFAKTDTADPSTMPSTQ